MTLPGEAKHTLAYDLADRQTTYAPPGGTSAIRRYAADGALLESEVAGTGATAFTLDATTGRPTSVTSPSGTVTTQFTDATPRPSRLTHQPAGGGVAEVSTFTYDGPFTTAVSATGSAPATYAFEYSGPGLRLGRTRFTSGTDVDVTELAYDTDGLLTKYEPFTFTRGGPGGAASRVSDGTIDHTTTHGGPSTRHTRVGASEIFA